MTTTWGSLHKSQVDSQTIADYIVQLIAVHNNDPDSHLETGQSLQSHKASEIIDHLAYSIVEDKIESGAVTTEKLSFDKMILRPTFSSLDSFIQVKEGSGASIWANVVEVWLQTGASSGDVTSLGIETSLVNVTSASKPFFQCYLNFSANPEYIDMRVGIGAYNPFSGEDFFGFSWVASSQKMYAFYCKDSINHSFEISGFDSSFGHTFRAVMVDVGNTFEYYIDGILVHTFSSVALSLDSSELFCLSIKNSTSSGGMQLAMRDFLYVQEY